MARIEFAREVADDLERIVELLSVHGVAHIESRLTGILRAFEALEFNPLIGRPDRLGNRELVIGRDSSGYVALYRFVDEIDTAFVLAIRAQREAGYTRP